MKFLIGLVLLFVVSCLSRKLDLDYNSKIVGGYFANDNQFPHQVAILHKGRLRCGGSIISESWILTAAHCLLARREQ